MHGICEQSFTLADVDKVWEHFATLTDASSTDALDCEAWRGLGLGEPQCINTQRIHKQRLHTSDIISVRVRVKVTVKVMVMVMVKLEVKVRFMVNIRVRVTRGGLFPHTHACKVGLSGMWLSEGVMVMVRVRVRVCVSVRLRLW